MALGLTNLLLRRLVTKGHLRARQLNPKKIEYLLTPRGFSEKAKKSYRYTLKTIHSLTLLKEKIQDVFSKEVARGTREFILLGQGDWQDLVELALRRFSGESLHLTRVNSLKEVPSLPHAVILYASEDTKLPSNGIPNINLLEALSETPLRVKVGEG